MRDFINIISEALVIEPTRISHGGPVYRIRSRTALDNILLHTRDLRGMVFDRYVDLWDAHDATHNAYETTFGDMGGYRIMLSRGHIEYNANDFESDENPEALFTGLPMIKRLFPDITNWQIGTNEI